MCRSSPVNTINASPSLLTLLKKIKFQCIHETCTNEEGIPYLEILRHIEQCNHIPETCPHCQIKVSKLLLNDHKESCVEKWKQDANKTLQSQQETERLRRANRSLSENLSERTRQYETEKRKTDESKRLNTIHRQKSETLELEKNEVTQQRNDFETYRLRILLFSKWNSR